MTLVEIFAAQIRAARALLNWSQDDLAKRAGLSRTVIARLETADVDARTSTTTSVRKVFDLAGVQLVDEQDGLFGVLISRDQPMRTE